MNFIKGRLSFSSGSRGLTLLESLIAMLVLSVGVLGVAVMHLSSLNTAHASYQRALVTLAAQDALERIWLEMVNSDDVSECPTVAELNAAGGVMDSWLDEWSLELLPGLGASEIVASSEDCQYELRVKWVEERFDEGADSSVLIFVASVPEFG